MVLFVKRSIERENNWGVIGYVSEQNYTESMPEARGQEIAHNADGPGGDADDVNNGLMVVTIW